MNSVPQDNNINTKAKIIRNIFSNWTGFAVSLLVTFFISPFVVHSLGNSNYGIWVLVGSLTGYMGLLDLGLKPAIVKYTAQYRTLKNDEKINGVINSCLAIYTVIGGIVILLGAVMAYFAPSIFKVPPESYEELRLVIIIVGVNVALGFPFGVFAATLNGFQRFDINNIISIIVMIIRTALIYIFLSAGGGLTALAYIMTIAALVEYLSKWYACGKIFPALKISFRQADKKTLKTLAKFSIYVLIIGIASRISFQSAAIVIGAFISTQAITFFAIGANLVQYWTQLVYTVSTTTTPVASSLEAQKDFDKLRKLILIGTRYSLLMILPVGYVFIILGEKFINLWMGPEYGPKSYDVLLILTWSHFGYLSQFISGSVFYGLGKVKLLAYMNLAMAAVNVALSVALAGPYGIIGVAWGTAIPLTLFGMFFLPIYACRVLKISLLEYIKTSYVPAIIASLPFLVALWVIGTFVVIESLVVMGVSLTAAFVVYIILGLPVGLKPEHRQSLIKRVKDILRPGSD